VIRRIVCVGIMFFIGFMCCHDGKMSIVLSMLPALLMTVICYVDYCAWKERNQKEFADIEYEYKCGILDNLSYIERLAKAKRDFWIN